MTNIIDVDFAAADKIDSSFEYLTRIRKLEEQLSGVLLELKLTKETATKLSQENVFLQRIMGQISGLAVSATIYDPPKSKPAKILEQPITTESVDAPRVKFPKGIRNVPRVPYSVFADAVIQKWGLPSDFSPTELERLSGFNRASIAGWRRTGSVPEAAMLILEKA